MENRESSVKILEAFIYESRNISQKAWGDIDKDSLMDYVVKNPHLAEKIYLKVGKDWQDNPKEKLKYPIADKNGTVYRYALSTALTYAKANNEKEVISKIEKLYKEFDIENT